MEQHAIEVIQKDLSFNDFWSIYTDFKTEEEVDNYLHYVYEITFS